MLPLWARARMPSVERLPAHPSAASATASMETFFAAVVILLIGVLAFCSAMRAINGKLGLLEDKHDERHWGR